MRRARRSPATFSSRTWRCGGATRHIGVAADHGGFGLNQQMARMMREAGFTVVDFGDCQPTADDDYADFVVPMARASSPTRCRACGRV